MADNVSLIVNETIDNVVINPGITTQVIDVNVTGTDTYVDINVTPNVTILNINEVTGGSGGSQNLQSVTDIGNSTTNNIDILTNNTTSLGITSSSDNDDGVGIDIAAGIGMNINAAVKGMSVIGGDISAEFISQGGTSFITYNDNGIGASLNLGSTSNGIEINSGTSSTGLPIKINKNGVDKLTIDQEGQLSIVKKVGGLSSQFLMADGSTSISGGSGVPLSYIDNKDNSRQLQLNYLDSDNALFDAFYLRALNDSGTFEASNQLLSSLAKLRAISYTPQSYTQQINADKFVKLGGTSTQFLMADGSVTIGGGGATNLTTTQTSTNFTINSDTGTDAVVPLGNGSLAGASLNDYTTAEKALVATIPNINTNAVNRDTVKLAEAINKGQAVYVSGASGTNILVSKASNISEALSSKTFGLLETTGVLNDIVNVVSSGLLSGLNTSTATIGDAVWLGTSGNLIFGLANKPVAPANLVYIGIVTRVSTTVGEIYISVQNGFELTEIHDILLTSVANNEGLFYDSSTSLWKNKSIQTVLGYTPVASNTAITGATNTKITYDAKGLVTAGTTLIASDIPTIAQSQVTNLTTDLAAKQVTLVSATNIKTVNGNTLLGSGDLVISGSSAQTGTIIVTSGTSFTTPSTITTSTVFIIELVGAGGGGAGGLVSNGHGSAGGGGGYIYEKITGLSPSTTYTCAIGTGGAGGAAVSNGTAGGSTTLTIGAATFTASGGGGGVATLGSAGGAGGTGTATGATPDIAITGQNGDYTALTTAATVHSSRGGGSPKGWGLGGAGVGQSFNGLAGSGYGGGGSSGKGGTFTGGAGSNGIIYCQYYN